MRTQLYQTTKRFLDVTVSVVLLIGLSPVLGVTAAAIRLTMGRPIFFRQQRPGLGGKLFLLVKFRTMRTGNDSDGARLTPIGARLRAWSIDEIPELWHVVTGEMSLVGPRPLLPRYLPLYTERQAMRHDVKPGITGLAQVNGRNELGWDDRLELDAVYVETRCLSLDLKILAKTLQQVLARSGITATDDPTMPFFTGSNAGPTSAAN